MRERSGGGNRERNCPLVVSVDSGVRANRTAPAIRAPCRTSSSPKIDNGGSLPRRIDEATAALIRQGRLYEYGGHLVTIKRSRQRVYITPMDEGGLTEHLARAAAFGVCRAPLSAARSGRRRERRSGRF
jgi:hypothetical protein